MTCGVEQYDALQHEFDIDEAADALLQIEARGVGTIALGTPARAHARDFIAQTLGVARRGEKRFPNAREARAEHRIARDDARTHERLQFPRPRALAQIRLVGIDAEHEQSLAAVGPQA